MAIFLAIALGLHFLMEMLAAIGLIMKGVKLAGDGELWSMHYGFAALAPASVSLWLGPYRRQAGALTVALGLLCSFHTGLAISIAIAGDMVGGMVGHAVLAVLSIALFVLRGRLVETDA
ncbi:MAG: hypothetical protein AAF513_08280 [Pseudomonadota bacterium]